MVNLKNVSSKIKTGVRLDVRVDARADIFVEYSGVYAFGQIGVRIQMCVCVFV